MKCETHQPPAEENHIEQTVPILSSLQSLGEAADLVHPQLADHHVLTGFIAASLAATMGLSLREQEIFLCAGLVHDIGAFAMGQRLDVARFDAEDVFPHCRAGYLLLNDFPSLSHIAGIVKYHHIRWDDGCRSGLLQERSAREGHLLHLADRVAVSLLDKKGSPLEIGKRIKARILGHAGTMFDPALVEAFQSLSEKERFWFEVTSLSDEVVDRYWHLAASVTGVMPLSEMANFFSRVIDFRSSFTATHSKSVSVVAEKLGHLSGFSHEESRLLNVAGHLHDLGKMGVPKEIIEKPGKLTEEEFDIMKIHPYYTFQILRKVPGLEQISRWCSYHHEYLDGSGYPSHVTASGICRQSRILTVADTFVALTEDRPYRPGMPMKEVKRILREFADAFKFDKHIVQLATLHADEIYQCMAEAKTPENRSYEAFLDSSTFPAFS